MNTSVKKLYLGKEHRDSQELSDFSLPTKNSICQDKYSFAEISNYGSCVDLYQ